ncbi:hypothetical protein FOMG_16925 [Fusarium oxysporum f. sp. melonis 26406]|uniref:Uncharacterized protein n=1 Tax=Fusarium oxysporum f. sp. melonis 26406 TaxID=1089452 RepID=W9ZDA5_FUSOX|nr:hypothetical protein FOMG_16925 [Fusarium oxysporum f. sp. melonis 26406]EXK26522.1 hypothetical protein FOMG_16925 [Fusarium oxysporum f. sp. melonis 26406]
MSADVRMPRSTSARLITDPPYAVFLWLLECLYWLCIASKISADGRISRPASAIFSRFRASRRRNRSDRLSVSIMAYVYSLSYPHSSIVMQRMAGHLAPKGLVLMSAHLPQFIALSRTPELSVFLLSPGYGRTCSFRLKLK